MLELFELELFGSGVTRRYRQLRPEVEALPWGTLDTSGFSPAVLAAARRAWTGAAFQEFRTGSACAATLQALIEAQAPLDLIALASRFPLDEMVHVEMCSRLAAELGGGIALIYDPSALVQALGADSAPLVRAAHMMVAFFCVGESLSIPLLNSTARAAQHPLVKQVLRRIVLDEADHGTFGWAFLDWAAPLLGDDDRAALGRTANRFIAIVWKTWTGLQAQQSSSIDDAHALGWLGTDDYLALARRALHRQVIAPLRARHIPLSDRPLEGRLTLAPGIAPPLGR